MSYVFIAAGLGLSIWMAKLAIVLLAADRIEASKGAARAPRFRDALFGRVRVQDDWLPDARVQGGMIFNRKKNRIEICGRLSADALRHTFR